MLIGIHRKAIPADIEDFFDHLFNDSIPEGFSVELGVTEHYGLNYCMEINSVRRPPYSDTFIVVENDFKDLFFKFALHVGHFFIRVSFLNPSLNLKIRSVNIKTEVLYPYQKDIPLISSQDDILLTSGNPKTDLSIFLASLVL